VLERPGFSAGSIGLITMLLSRRGKRVGDMGAGTVVVQERVPIRDTAPPPMHPALASWAMGLDLTGVTDDVALYARQFLARAPHLGEWAREDLGGRIVADLVARTSAPVPPGVPGWVYVSTILAERRRRELMRMSTPPPLAAPPAATPQPPPAEPVQESPQPPTDSGPFTMPR